MGDRIPRLRGRRAVERRRRFLSVYPLCRQCEARGYVTPATEVDHIVALTNGGADTEANLQSLCSECHSDKTRSDLGYRAIGVDRDGKPTDPAHHWNRPDNVR